MVDAFSCRVPMLKFKRCIFSLWLTVMFKKNLRSYDALGVQIETMVLLVYLSGFEMLAVNWKLVNKGSVLLR